MLYEDVETLPTISVSGTLGLEDGARRYETRGIPNLVIPNANLNPREFLDAKNEIAQLLHRAYIQCWRDEDASFADRDFLGAFVERQSEIARLMREAGLPTASALAAIRYLDSTAYAYADKSPLARVSMHINDESVDVILVLPLRSSKIEENSDVLEASAAS